jgi:hypothetical protein
MKTDAMVLVKPGLVEVTHSDRPPDTSGPPVIALSRIRKHTLGGDPDCFRRRQRAVRRPRWAQGSGLAGEERNG